MVANRALAPMSKLAAAQWATSETWIDGVDRLEAQHLYRAMDFLLEAREEVEQEVYCQVADLLNLEVDLLYFDTTSTYFEAEEPDELRAIFGGRMRLFASGGAHLQEHIDVFFRAVGTPIVHGYGLTEGSCTVTCNAINDFKPGTLGLPLPGVEVAIAGDGEILVRGDIVMAGYYKREKASAETLAGGWLRTGDLGHLDADGYFRMTDRKKDILSTPWAGRTSRPRR